VSSPSRLADRVASARHSRFVGRVEELDLFRSALVVHELPFSLLYLYGPGGGGKTALVHEFEYICQQAGVPCVYLDARDVRPAPGPFLEAVAAAMHLPPGSSPLEQLSSGSSRQVLIIDSYEVLVPVEGWLRDTFLPQLSQDVLVVMASTDPPSAAWRADPGWQPLLRVLPLGNLTPKEGKLYLTGRSVPEEQQAEILSFTHGYPLALSLVADLLDQRPGARFQADSAPEILRVLLGQLLRGVPGGAHRAALEACAVVRFTTEPLLAAVLGIPDARDLFEWLRGLSFMQSGPQGLFPHDLVRDILTADLRWRNADCYREFCRRAQAYYVERLRDARGPAQQRALFDYLYLHRDSKALRSYFEWHEVGTLLAEAPKERDLPVLAGIVAEHEGDWASRIAAHWFARQPHGVTVLWNGRQIAGFLAVVSLHEATAGDLQADPVARLAWEYLRSSAPLGPGEGACVFRFWMARDGYQSVSPVQSLIFIRMLLHHLVASNLAFTFVACADPDAWAPLFRYAGLTRLPGADFDFGGRRYGIYGHDWRTTPLSGWLEILSWEAIPTAPSSPVGARQSTDLVVVLSQPDFQLAVRRALRDYAQPAALRGNPLLRSRLIADRAATTTDQGERVVAFQHLLREAAESLKASPRTSKYFQALDHTYFQPAPSQERAAELLDIPFSTFRRHLKAGVERVAELLWMWELDESGGQPADGHTQQTKLSP
jgi:hypothetical protein